jgi:hypothetical protein
MAVSDYTTMIFFSKRHFVLIVYIDYLLVKGVKWSGAHLLMVLSNNVF